MGNKIDTKVLYSNYKRTSSDEIRELLSRILIVSETHKGKGSVVGYYTADKDTMEKIRKNPRGISHTFDFKPDELVDGLKEFKRIRFLVKSSSRFFLKPDIGEVFDQMSDDDKKQTKAVETLTDSVEIDGSEGEHFVCTAILLK
ncbi:MAG: hypothetical protein WC631_01685 [Candidatus Paceibacterota bacterium]|jgi:hypothetical protein